MTHPPRRIVLFLLSFLGMCCLETLEAKPFCLGPSGSKEGNCAIDFELSSLSGKKVRLSSFQGKVVFLHFWATWCEPCRSEWGEIQSLNRQLPSDRFVILGVSLDQDAPQVVPSYVQEVLGKNSFEILFDPGKKISKAYGTFKVPETFVIDKEGKIRDKIVGPYSWKNSIVTHYFQLLTQ